MPLVPHVSTGQIVASTWGNLVADHVIMRFTTAAQRASQLPAPIVGQLTTLDTAVGLLDVWNGTAWVPASSGAERLYAELTASVTINATTPPTATTILAPAAITYDATPVLLEFFSPAVIAPTSGNLILSLWDGATDIGFLGQLNGCIAPTRVTRRFTPSAGSHAYSIRGYVDAGGSATVGAGSGAGAGVFVPAYLRVTRV